MYVHVQLSNGNLLSVLDKHYLTVRCLRFTDDGTHFISGADDNSVLVWSLSKWVSSSTFWCILVIIVVLMSVLPRFHNLDCFP